MGEYDKAVLIGIAGVVLTYIIWSAVSGDAKKDVDNLKGKSIKPLLSLQQLFSKLWIC